MLNENLDGTLCLCYCYRFTWSDVYLFPSRKENIGERSMEEIWRETGDCNGPRLEGPILGKINAQPVEKDGL